MMLLFLLAACNGKPAPADDKPAPAPKPMTPAEKCESDCDNELASCIAYEWMTDGSKAWCFIDNDKCTSSCTEK